MSRIMSIYISPVAHAVFPSGKVKLNFFRAMFISPSHGDGYSCGALLSRYLFRLDALLWHKYTYLLIIFGNILIFMQGVHKGRFVEMLWNGKNANDLLVETMVCSPVEDWPG